MVIIPSNEATAREENAISIDLVRPIFPPFFSFYIEQKERKASTIERQHLSTF